MEPGLNTIKTITDFIFVKNLPIKTDLIIVPGSSHPQLAQKAVDLYKQKFAHKILFTGGLNPKLNKNECDFGVEIALAQGIPKQNIFWENQSSNTKENAEESAKFIKQHQLPHKKILIVCKPYHARRVKMSFAAVFPNSHLYLIPTKDKTNITDKNWWKDEEKIKKVLGEVGKISKYFLKGDLLLT